MLKSEFEIKNNLGLHARPAAAFVQVCNKFASNIDIKAKNRMVNAKSIIGVLALGIANGDIVEIEIDGPDEEQALIEITELLEVKLLEMN